MNFSVNGNSTQNNKIEVNFERDINVLSKKIKFYNKFTPKEQHEKFEIISVHFEPFEDMDYVWENENVEEAYKSLEEYCHSTIYQGFRYFFNNLENLKKFSEMAEKGIL